MAGHDRDVRTLAGSPVRAETLGGSDLNDEVRGMVSHTLPDEAVNRKGAPASQVEGGAPTLIQTASAPPQPSSAGSSKGTVGQSAPRLRPARARVVGASRAPDLTAPPRPTGSPAGAVGRWGRPPSMAIQEGDGVIQHHGPIQECEPP